MENNIFKVINDIDEYIITVYNDYSKALSKANILIKEIQTYIVQFLENIEKYNNFGENIQVEILLMQLKNLMDAIQYKDQVLLADTLEYEIKESLLIYGELVEKYGR